MPAEYLTIPGALAAGLLGSGHCLGMCGGIATLPGAGGAATRVLVFNLGRLVSYAIVGALAGGFGAGAGRALAGTEAALWLRAFAGVLIVLVGLFLVLGDRRWLPVERLGARVWSRLGPVARRLAARPSGPRLLLLGMLWGWLPCGLVYTVALAAAVAGGALSGAATMIAFGFGTLPAMGALGLAGRRIGGWLGARPWRQAIGAMLLVAGLWTLASPLWHLGDPGHAHTHRTASMAPG